MGALHAEKIPEAVLLYVFRIAGGRKRRKRRRAKVTKLHNDLLMTKLFLKQPWLNLVW